MLIELPVYWTIIINIALWLIIHLSIAYLATILPQGMINVDSPIYKERKWEKGGRLYERYFRVRLWKELLPDGSAIFKKGFRKKRMASAGRQYIERFIIEVCRAEMAHWIVMICSPVFFIWNPPWAGYVMIAYAVAANLPCIIAQRYNRIRLRRLLID